MKDLNPKDYPNARRVAWKERGSFYRPAWWVRTIERGHRTGYYVLLASKRDPSVSVLDPGAFKLVERSAPPDHVEPENWKSPSAEERYNLDPNYGCCLEGMKK